MSSKTTEPRKIVLDTNVFIDHPDILDKLLCPESRDEVYIPAIVVEELDGLKKSMDFGTDAMDALKSIENHQLKNPHKIKVVYKLSMSGMGISKNKADHQIVAIARNLNKPEVNLLSNDVTVRILARMYKISVSGYIYHQSETPTYHELQHFEAQYGDIESIGETGTMYIKYNPLKHGDIIENAGVIFTATDKSTIEILGEQFAAIRKGEYFRLIDRNNVNAFGVRPKSSNGNGYNWLQLLAMEQLMDQNVRLVFLKGGAGTGKTLLALASAIQQKRNYWQIIVARPMIHLEDKDYMGYLPGNTDEKLNPWFAPIKQNLSFLTEQASGTKEKDTISTLQEKGKIIFIPLDYIRGQTMNGFIIIDEAQNLTIHQVKTIITRAGEHSKIVFTGDLGQIDRWRKLSPETSGLAYAIERMKNQPQVAVTVFRDSIRSPLAALADKLL